MTSFAFILGVLPLVTAYGAGYEMRQALGTAVFFGMIGVTFFGIFLTPVFYVAIRWLTTKVTGNTAVPGHHAGMGGPNGDGRHASSGEDDGDGEARAARNRR